MYGSAFYTIDHRPVRRLRGRYNCGFQRTDLPISEGQLRVVRPFSGVTARFVGQERANAQKNLRRQFPLKVYSNVVPSTFHDRIACGPGIPSVLGSFWPLSHRVRKRLYRSLAAREVGYRVSPAGTDIEPLAVLPLLIAPNAFASLTRRVREMIEANSQKDRMMAAAYTITYPRYALCRTTSRKKRSSAIRLRSHSHDSSVHTGCPGIRIQMSA